MRFRMIFLIIALVELVSLVAHFFSWFNAVGFLIITGVALVLSLKRLEYGLCFVLAELILGGKGYLFSLELGNTLISIRMALFVVVMAVWMGKLVGVWIHNYHTQPPSPGLWSPSPFGRGEGEGVLKWWGLFGLAIVWGLVVGFLWGNNFGDLFLDANGYFYAVLVLPFAWSVMQMDANEKREWMRMLGMVFFVATTWVAFETLFLVYFWTHGLNNYIAANLRPVYEWIRDTGVGEITWLEGNFARVFLQSQIYNVMAFFVVLVWYVQRSNLRCLGDWISRYCFYILILNTAVILTSLSRSFWVGTLAGLAVLVVMVVQSRQIKQLGKMIATLLIATILAVLLLFTITRFPFPQPSDIDLSFLKDRSKIGSEDAAASRWNLLPPMISAVLKHPIIGSGFGANVTYISNDPRIREVSVTGEYTTYAFEWGWVDVWLKMGLLGLISLAGLIGSLAYRFYKAGFTRLNLSSATINLGGLAGLAGLAAIHFFTPYLNHPLGFGILILATVLLVDNTIL